MKENGIRKHKRVFLYQQLVFSFENRVIFLSTSCVFVKIVCLLPIHKLCFLPPVVIPCGCDNIVWKPCGFLQFALFVSNRVFFFKIVFFSSKSWVFAEIVFLFKILYVCVCVCTGW